MCAAAVKAKERSNLEVLTLENISGGIIVVVRFTRLAQWLNVTLVHGCVGEGECRVAMVYGVNGSIFG